MRELRLALLSTARINAAIRAGADLVGGIDVVAVGGRDTQRASRYAEEYKIPRALGSYDAVLADPEVDAVYIALPNALHADWALRALEAGKHVLVEKPFSIDPAVVENCFEQAAARGLVLSEGLMWRHGEQAQRLMALVREGAIGELRFLRASFSFILERPGDVRLDKRLGGGSLLDLGPYCVSAARLLAGEPREARAVARIGEGGVDGRTAAIMRHDNDVLSAFDCGFDTRDAQLEVIGSEGRIRLSDPWLARQPTIVVERDRTEPEVIELEPRDQYSLELSDFAAVIRDGREPLLGRADAIGQAEALRMLHVAAGIELPVAAAEVPV